MSEVITGYEGGDSDEKDTRLQYWRLEKIEPAQVYGTMGQVICQKSGEPPKPRGVIHFEDMQEFEWLRRRISGERNPKAGE